MLRTISTKSLFASSLLLATLSLTGCPFFGSTSGSDTFDLKAVAVTSKKSGTITSTMRLSWGKHSTASLYKIYKTPQGGDKQMLNAVTELKFEEAAAAGTTATYTVEAVSSDGKSLATTADKTLTVLASEVGQVTGLKVNDADAGSAAVTVSNGTPKLSWSAAPNANAYYVTVQEVSDSKPTVFSAFTADAFISLGDTIPLSSLDIPTFPQSPGSLTYGKNYTFNVSAVRTGTNNLTAATSFDIAPGETTGKISYF